MIKLINKSKNYHQSQVIVLQQYRLIKIMRIRATTSKKNSTEDLPKALNFLNMRKRVSQIKYKASSKSFNIRKSKIDNNQPQVEKTIIYKKASDLESDTSSTNFWPAKQQTPISLASKISSQQYTVNRRSQDAKLTLTRPQSHIMNMRSRYRSFKKQGRGIDIETFQKQIQYFSNLYELLGNVLASIKNGLQDVQNTVSAYGQFIRDPYLSFMDDFTQGKSQKVKKTVKTSRIHEFLSIAYLFLQIAQDRIDNNQSYLVNFIGYSLSNLIFTAKTYILLERRPEFPETQFEKQMNQFQINSYGSILSSIDDVLLRVQHNNQIITMIHKKLGKWNPKFEECISAFLKNAERRKYTTCLCSHYIFQYLAMHIHQVELVGISQFLQVSPTPYLAPPKNDYTLIIQPLGILKNNQQIRPYLMQFIKWASKYFDIVLWTWEMPNEVQDIVQLLDPYLFSKLYRYHCIIKDQIYTKDLNRLGRNLKKTIIIDYDERIFANTPKNGFVARWKGHFKDKGLLVISQIFQEMIGSQSQVQDMLTFYAQQLHSIRGV